MSARRISTGHGDSTDRPWRGVVTRDGWKYVLLDDRPWMMFNLNEDPYELVNLAQNPGWRDPRKRLHEMTLQWMNKTGDRFDFWEE